METEKFVRELQSSDRGRSKYAIYFRIDYPKTGTVVDDVHDDVHDDDDEDEIKGVFVFSHGLHEHSDSFEDFFKVLCANFKIACVSFDHRGHGLSESYKGAHRHQIESFEESVRDMREACEIAKERFGLGIPISIGGVSMGGLFALHCALTYPKEYFAAIVLIAPAINVQWTMEKRFLAKLGGFLAKCLPNAKIVPATNPEFLSDDFETIENFKNDPMNYIGKARAKFGNEILKAMKSLALDDYAKLNGIAKNVLAIHAEKDKATDCKATEQLFTNHLKDIENKKFVKFTHTNGHLLLFEPGKDFTRDLIGRFLVDSMNTYTINEKRKDRGSTSSYSMRSSNSSRENKSGEETVLKSKL
jgi:alpha-beta hydrolase superfamily lysophospholipase